MMTPSTASSFLLNPNCPRRGAWPMVTSETSRTRTGTPLRADDDAADVLHILDQAQAAHVIKLAALRIKSAAGVGVVHGKLLEHLRDGDVIAVEPRGVEQHLVLHHGAAKSGIIGDVAHLLVLALDHPSFESF